jgi:hypothetical protein
MSSSPKKKRQKISGARKFCYRILQRLLPLVVNFEPKDPWFKPQAAQKTKKKSFFFPK